MFVYGIILSATEIHLYSQTSYILSPLYLSQTVVDYVTDESSFSLKYIFLTTTGDI